MIFKKKTEVESRPECFANFGSKEECASCPSREECEEALLQAKRDAEYKAAKNDAKEALTLLKRTTTRRKMKRFEETGEFSGPHVPAVNHG